MLGHTDAGFTMNTYMHVTDTMQQNVANTMGNLVNQKETEKRNKIIQFTAQAKYFVVIKCTKDINPYLVKVCMMNKYAENC